MVKMVRKSEAEQRDYNPNDDSPYHPLVDRALDTMDGDLKELKKDREDMDGAREEMSESKARALSHMNDAISLQRELVRADSLAKGQERVLGRLESEQGKLQTTHDSLYGKLDAIMSPKLSKAKQRLEKENAAVDQAKTDEAKWDGKAKQYRATALEALKVKKEALKALKEADTELAQARKNRETAEIEYRKAKTGVNGKVEAFRFADTELRAAVSKRADREAAVKDASAAADELQGIFDAEVKRIDEALEVGKKRFNMRIQRTNAIIAEANHAEQELKTRFSQWQESQRERAEEAATTEEKYKDELKGYDDKRETIFEDAQSKAAKKAESVSDWADDDWAWAHHGSDAAEIGAQPVELDGMGAGPAPGPAEAASPAAAW
jgi:DNA repair exonuclease SbcCD ATPase subunit